MKKMRRLIPAIAMLLVSAVMLSTASFAWFTMNDEVTTTGMQVQAKASGNLIIGTEKLTAASSGISVDFGGTKKNLIPITLKDGVWYDADGVNIDPIYGTIGTVKDDEGNDVLDTLNTVTVGDTATDHFSEYVCYLGTAGEEAITGNLLFDMTALVNGDLAIAPAYTVAFYIVADGSNRTSIDWTKPDYTFNQLQNATQTGWIDTGKSVTVPSTYGKVADTAVGLMIVMRVYVDGALEINGGIAVPAKKNITAVGADQTYSAATMSGYTFYTDAAGTVPYNGTLQDGQLLSNVVASYWDGTTTNQPNAAATYVNNTSVPAAGTSFGIDFRVGSVNNG